MKLLQAPKLSDTEDCPYLKDELARQTYFFAHRLTKEEFDFFLEKGWRKFGLYYFKPECPSCQKCIPLRVNLDEFSLRKSHKKILKKNKDIEVKRVPLDFKLEHYELYKKHTQVRFDEAPTDIDQFIATHYQASTPAFILEFYLDKELIACGYLDESKKSLSSVYFIYNPDHAKRSLGIFGALKEIELSQKMKKSYYYLGYWIQENHFMSYKSQFHGSETLEWNSLEWCKLVEVE